MTELQFEWDERKNEINQQKHGIAFLEAQTAFFDEQAIRINDPDHSQQEERFILFGKNYQGHLLVVCHCFRSAQSVIRIISARKAGRNERRNYEGQLR